MGFFDKLKKITSNLFSGFTEADEDFFEELEETLIMADLGVDAATDAVEKLRTKVRKEHLQSQEAVREGLREILMAEMEVGDTAMKLDTKPSVCIFIGVNGVGKTTSIGKIAASLKKQGKRVMLCAADTFRAAAVEQLGIWAERTGSGFHSKGQDADPAAVAWEAMDVAIRDQYDILFIDTAGMRKRGKIDENVERYSVVRSLAAVDRSDVCVIMIDANEGITEQDTKVAGYAHEQGKACIFAVNKWDIVSKDTKTMKNFTMRVREEFAFMSYAEIIFISAKTGQRVDKLLELIKKVNEQHKRRITTGMLNDVLNEAMAKQQPPSDKGRRLKVYYGTQAATAPPTFILFANSKDLFHYSYLRFIENQVREAFGFEGTPIKFIVREKNEKKM